jgi:hypothetical protein
VTHVLARAWCHAAAVSCPDLVCTEVILMLLMPCFASHELLTGWASPGG